MSDNVYAPPQSNLTDTAGTQLLDASRWSRLGASLIDTLSIMIIALPVMYFTGGFDGITSGIRPSFGYNLAMAVLTICVFLAINGKSLATQGQTLGKKILDIKIVDLEGNLPKVKQHLVVRYAAYMIPGQIPVVGPFINIINILFIFGSQKRCAHDYIAGTKVVVCNS